MIKYSIQQVTLQSSTVFGINTCTSKITLLIYKMHLVIHCKNTVLSINSKIPLLRLDPFSAKENYTNHKHYQNSICAWHCIMFTVPFVPNQCSVFPDIHSVGLVP